MQQTVLLLLGLAMAANVAADTIECGGQNDGSSYDVELPYETELSQPLVVGDVIYIRGRMPRDNRAFAVLLTESDSRRVVFFLHFDMQSGLLIMNSGSYTPGNMEKLKAGGDVITSPWTSGDIINMQIRIKPKYFEITTPKEIVQRFIYRNSYDRISNIVVQGSFSFHQIYMKCINGGSSGVVPSGQTLEFCASTISGKGWNGEILDSDNNVVGRILPQDILNKENTDFTATVTYQPNEYRLRIDSPILKSSVMRTFSHKSRNNLVRVRFNGNVNVNEVNTV